MQLLHDPCASPSCSGETTRPTLPTMMNSPTSSALPARPLQPGAAPRVAFIGGGNMASAILGGLLRCGHPVDRIAVVEPHAPQADVLREKFGVAVDAAGGPALQGADVVVW